MKQLHRIVLPLVVLSLAIGCGKEEKAESSAGAKTEGAKTGGEKEEAPPPEKTEKSGLDLFTGSEVALPAPIAKLAFKMPVEEAAKLTPTLVGEAKKYGALEGFKKAKAIISLTQDKTHLRSFVFTIENPLDELTAHLDKLWGKHVEVKESTGKIKRYWTNAKGGLRAYADERGGGGSRVVFEPVMGFDAFVGSEKGRFGFEKIPLLGASEEEVKKAYAKELIGVTQKKEGRLAIPIAPHEHTQYVVFLNLKPEGGKIKEWQVTVSYSIDRSAQEKMLSLLEEKFGPGKKGKMYIDYKGPPKVKVDHTGEQHTIWVK